MVGCGSNQVWAKLSVGNWGAFTCCGTANIVAVGANQLDDHEWVIDATGATWLINSSGGGGTPVARPDPLNAISHSIGIFGPSHQVLGLGGTANQNSDLPTQFWANPGWSTFLGGFGKILSANNYTAAIVAGAGAGRQVFVYSLE